VIDERERTGSRRSPAPGIPHASVRFVALVLLAALLISGCALGGDEGVGGREPGVEPASAAERVLQSTVEIRALTGGGRGGLGTGVVLTEDGLVVTNDHVVLAGGESPASRITVVAADGRRDRAEVVARAPDLDLAFLRVDIDGLRPARFQADLDEVSRGDRVFAIGAPRHFDDHLVRGQVRRVLRDAHIAERRGLETLIVSSVRLEQGFSGGPLADARGRVIGINVATVTQLEGGAAQALAIPATTVLEAAPDLQAVAD
jgi:putative serine protease PepD